MFFKKNRQLNTIEAYACNCNTLCYDCIRTCTPSSCSCDTVYYNVPFASMTSDNSSDNTSSVKEGSGLQEWSRYAK